jgi:phage terminase large subunit
VTNYVAFLDRCRDKWGACRDAFVDSADQATITEFKKYKRHNGCVYSFNPAWKQMKIVDRITSQLGWFAKDQFLICDTCRHYVSELESYCWKEDKDLEPEDANDHLINSAQYAWIPYAPKIGGNT